jgi:DNA replication licensing factor MCM3
VLDNLEDEHNRAIGEHITRLHRFVPAGVDEGAPIPESFFNKNQNDDTENQNETSVFTKFNKLLHVGLKPIGESKKGS